MVQGCHECWVPNDPNAEPGEEEGEQVYNGGRLCQCRYHRHQNLMRRKLAIRVGHPRTSRLSSMYRGIEWRKCK
jgi:hypothetical protein